MLPVLTHFFGYPLKLGVYVATALEFIIGVLQLVVIFAGSKQVGFVEVIAIIANFALVLIALVGFYGTKEDRYYDYLYVYIIAQPIFIIFFLIMFVISLLSISVSGIIFGVPIIAIVVFALIVSFSYYKGPPTSHNATLTADTTA